VKLIFVNGTFDVIHRGHIELFNYAKSLGDKLIVAIDTDRRVKQLKGDKRPVNNQNDRKFLLENIKSIDEVRFFDTDDELIDLIKNCDIMVKGSDYKNKSVLGQNYCKEIVYYERTEHSTTKVLQHLINR